MELSQKVNVSIGLSVTPASLASFNVPLLLVDHADVPIDRRYRTVTRSTYSTILTSATDAYNWCAALWGQNYNPSQAIIGRWVSAASAPYNAFPSAEDDYAVWAALTNTGKFELDDGVNQEDISPDFTGDTSMADVCASIQTALAASANFSGFTCSLDALDRITIYDNATGSAAGSFATGTPASGTDLSAAAYLGTEVSQAGLDAEALATAEAAIRAKANTHFIICQRGGSIAQKVAFSTAVNSLNKILLLVDSDANSKDSTATTDVPYQVEALSHQKTHICYTEHVTANGASADQHPDAAVIGEILSQIDKEGAISLSDNPLGGVSESGLDGDKTTVIPLTDDERSALEDKGCDYLYTLASQTCLCKGLAAGGNEIRVMIGKMFMEQRVAEDIYAYKIANDVVTFSDPDLLAIKNIILYWANEMAERGLLDKDTFDFSNFPEAADFTATQKATHTMTLSEVFTADVLSAVNDITMTMSFSV